MAYIDGDDKFRLNRKGRRWLEKQVGRKELRILQTDALKRSRESEAPRGKAWDDKKKLE